MDVKFNERDSLDHSSDVVLICNTDMVVILINVSDIEAVRRKRKLFLDNWYKLRVERELVKGVLVEFVAKGDHIVQEI